MQRIIIKIIKKASWKCSSSTCKSRKMAFPAMRKSVNRVTVLLNVFSVQKQEEAANTDLQTALINFSFSKVARYRIWRLHVGLKSCGTPLNWFKIPIWFIIYIYSAHMSLRPIVLWFWQNFVSTLFVLSVWFSNDFISKSIYKQMIIYFIIH